MINFLNPKKIISESAVGGGMFVADFGFGNGAFLSILSREVGEYGKIFAFDIQKDLVDKANLDFSNSEIYNIEFLHTDLEKKKSTKLKNESVDFILISSVFFQVNKKEKIVKEAFRILKPNGRVLFIDWKESFSGIGPEEKLIFQEIDAIKIFENNAFRFDRRVESGKYHYAFLMIKK